MNSTKTLSEVIERWLKDQLPFGDEAAQALGHDIYPHLSEIASMLIGKVEMK